jgi:hypothetical protein
MTSSEKRPDGVIIIRDDLGKPIQRVMAKGLGPKKTIRQLISRVTNGGEELVTVLYDLALGKPVAYNLPDGRLSEPMIPTFEVRRAAAKDLLEMFAGKAVPPPQRQPYDGPPQAIIAAKVRQVQKVTRIAPLNQDFCLLGENLSSCFT